MMTLEEAIKHCKDVALSCTNKECALEHFQLLKWLQEYSNILEKQKEKPVWTDNDRTMAFTLLRDIDQMTYIGKEGKNERLEWLNSLDDRFNNE